MGHPKDLEGLRAEIVRRYDELSPRLKQVAKYVLDNPNDVALQTLAVIANRCKVQPSTIVRFAKTFGYEGASDIQKLFRDEMLNLAPSSSYSERIRQYSERSGGPARQSPHDLMREFADNNILALRHLQEVVRNADLDRALDLIGRAAAVYIVGLRRSFPVAAYLAYALRHVDKRAYLIDGVAGMLAEQAGIVERKDLLIAISFHPYARETAEVVTAEPRARRAGDRDQRQPAEPDRPRGRSVLRDQGCGSAAVPLADRIAVPRADAGHQLCVPRRAAHTARQ